MPQQPPAAFSLTGPPAVGIGGGEGGPRTPRQAQAPLEPVTPQSPKDVESEALRSRMALLAAYLDRCACCCYYYYYYYYYFIITRLSKPYRAQVRRSSVSTGLRCALLLRLCLIFTFTHSPSFVEGGDKTFKSVDVTEQPGQDQLAAQLGR